MSTQEAMEKLNKEAKKANSLGKTVAKVMICYFKGGAHEGDAGKVEDKQKTVSACATHIWNLAMDRSNGNMAVLTDAEVGEAIKAYYKLSERPDMRAAMPCQTSQGEKNEGKKAEGAGMRYTPEDEMSLFEEEEALSGGKENAADASSADPDHHSEGKGIMALSLDDFL